MKKDCHNCVHLDHYDKDGPEDSSAEGFYCNGRAYGNRVRDCEQAHIEKLQNVNYRLRGKKCCEPKPPLIERLQKHLKKIAR